MCERERERERERDVSDDCDSSRSGWGLWLRRDGRKSKSVAKGGGVRGERSGKWKKEGKETHWMKKKKKKWEMKNWGKIFAGRKKNLGGKLVLYIYF